jgi:hypothetical protein
MLASVVIVGEPNMLRGSFCWRYGNSEFSRRGQIVQSDQQPAYRAHLTHLVVSTEQNKSVSLPEKGKVHRKVDRWRCGYEIGEEAKVSL